MYFLGSQEKCSDHELKVLNLTQGFDIKSLAGKPKGYCQQSCLVKESIDEVFSTSRRVNQISALI